MKSKAPLRPSLRIENTVYISGQVGINPQTSKLSNDSFENEVRQMMDNLKLQLENNDGGFNNLVSVIAYLKSMKDYDTFNTIYGTYFEDKFPTRTCIAVLDLPLGASVEISGIAYIPQRK
ncbi:RidA family protein [Zunongwangia sp. SCSIO 43204]|uniref:RidA family protein n=1 Tax=Zunongwangia pacifica TaxID=2911062 RepID=A0A9X1ZX97_9FLAO|nr:MULTISPECIES: RidA family protein [Zunongwangia]MCL6219005.1 RidA family protein [Zunongwangia pacifica]UAB86049.1 RidA family protein [Zunongwangia sp. SCSIO 43204]